MTAAKVMDVIARLPDRDGQAADAVSARNDFSDYDMLDAMIASALREIISSAHFCKRVSVEEQRAQKYDRF